MMLPPPLLLVIAVLLDLKMKIKNLQQYIQDNYSSQERKRQAIALETKVAKETLAKLDNEFNSVIKSKTDEEKALSVELERLNTVLSNSDKNSSGSKVAALITEDRQCDAEIANDKSVLDKLKKENQNLDRSLKKANETLKTLKQQYHKQMEVYRLNESGVDVFHNDVEEFVQRIQNAEQQLMNLSTDLQRPTAQCVSSTPGFYGSPSVRIAKELEQFDYLCDRATFHGGSPAALYSATKAKPTDAYASYNKIRRKI